MPATLSGVTPDEFLPPISRWSRLGGLALVGLFGGAIALSALFKYSVTVKAPAVIRPEGDLRIVEAAASGRVQQILVKANDSVQRGDPLVMLDDAEVRSRQQQVQGEIEQIQQQRSQIDQELTALEIQIEATDQQGQRAIAAALAELEQRQQAFHNEQTTTTAQVREANAAVQLAQEEYNRFQQLAGTGALAELELKEKAAALETAQARLEKALGLSNPSDAAVSKAREDVQQTRAREQANLARLVQSRASLRRQQADLLKELQAQQAALNQIRLDLTQLTIRAPTAGIIQTMSLRNPDQVLDAGDAIAQIAPDTARMVIQAEVSQSDISRIRPNQTANMRIDSCPYTDYGLLRGTVTAISPDTQPLEADRVDTMPVYQVEIAPAARSLQAVHQRCSLQSGMLARAEIVTQRETVLQTLCRRLRLAAKL